MIYSVHENVFAKLIIFVNADHYNLIYCFNIMK